MHNFSTSTELRQNFASLQPTVNSEVCRYIFRNMLNQFTSISPQAFIQMLPKWTQTFFGHQISHVSNAVQICQTLSPQWHSLSYCNQYCMHNIFYFAKHLIELEEEKLKFSYNSTDRGRYSNIKTWYFYNSVDFNKMNLGKPVLHEHAQNIFKHCTNSATLWTFLCI